MVPFVVFMAISVESRAQRQSSTDSPRVMELVRQGNALLEEGQTDKAIKKLSRANVRAKGSSFNALMGLARALHLRGDLREASERAQDATRVAPSDSDLASASSLAARCFCEATYGLDLNALGADQAAQLRQQFREDAARFLRQAFVASPETALKALVLLVEVFDEEKESKPMRWLLQEYLEREPEAAIASKARSLLALLETTPPRLAPCFNPPSKLYSPQPQYTRRARGAGIEGDVVLRYTIDERGNIGDVKLIDGLAGGGFGLNQAAIEAVKRWKFIPATLANGEPVAVCYTLTIRFELGPWR